MKLFPKEDITIDTLINENKNYTHDEINEKYISGEVRIVTEQARIQLTTIENVIESEDYILNPEYQRRHRWNNTKKSRLIESFIMNVPVPPIFLYEVDYSTYEVMDGLQRLSAIYDFYKNKFTLTGLEEWPELNGLKYSELPIQVKKGIDRRYLSSIILLKETAKTIQESNRLKEMVFERINSGGEKLEPQETRNALYNGPLNRLCIELSKNKQFRELWDIPSNIEDIEMTNDTRTNFSGCKLYEKMTDVELVLRFFAFRHIHLWDKSNLEEFLDFFLNKGNSFDETVLQDYTTLFNDTISLIYEILGTDAFKLYRERNTEWKLYNRPTKVLFDPIMYVFSQNLDKKTILKNNKERIKNGLCDFYKTSYDVFGGRNTGKTHVLDRISYMTNFINQYME